MEVIEEDEVEEMELGKLDLDAIEAECGKTRHAICFSTADRASPRGHYHNASTPELGNRSRYAQRQ